VKIRSDLILKLGSLVAATLCLAAIPVKNSLVELSGFLNAREEARFRRTDDNKVYSLHPGTKALVQEVKKFSDSGNYGLCLKIINANVSSSRDCYWVYYVPSRPTMKLIDIDAKSTEGLNLLKEWNNPKNQVSVSTFSKSRAALETKTPKLNTATLIVKKTESIRVPAVSPIKSTPATQDSSIAKTVITTAISMNQNFQQSIEPTPETKECKFCVPKVQKYEQCSSANNYFEKELDISRDNTLISLLKGQEKPRYIKDICFAGSLLSFGGPFKYCAPGDNGKPRKSVVRACVSERYNQLIRNSFEAVADCLGDYLSGSKETAHDSMVDMFGLMSVESGLHINSRSATVLDQSGNVKAGGAGGAGQLTQGAIQEINKNELALVKMHLARSQQPVCKLLETTLSVPMKDKFSQSCDRISMDGGNPLKNMIYTVAYQKQSRFSIRKHHLDSPLASHIFSSLSDTDKDFLERQLAIWAHNSGNGAIHQALRNYLRAYQGQDLTNRESIKGFLKGLRPYMRRANSGRINPDEPVNFWYRIQKRMEDLNNNAGDGQCVVGQN
jgi:hypothetical protein